MAPAKLDITIHQKSTFSLDVDLNISLLSANVYAQIWDRRLNTKITDMVVTFTNQASGEFKLTIDHTITTDLTKSRLKNAVWDLMVVFSTGVRTYYIEGDVIHDPGYTEP